MSSDKNPVTQQAHEINSKTYVLWNPLAEKLNYSKPTEIKAAADSIIDRIKTDEFKLGENKKNCTLFFAEGNQLLVCMANRLKETKDESQCITDYYGGRQIFRVLMVAFEYHPELQENTEALMPKSVVTCLPCRRDWYIDDEQNWLALAQQGYADLKKLPDCYHDPMYHALQAKNKTVVRYLLERNPIQKEPTFWTLPSKDTHYPKLYGDIWKFYQKERRKLGWMQASNAIITIALTGKNSESMFPSAIIALIQEYHNDLDQPVSKSYQFDFQHLKIGVSPEEVIKNHTGCVIL